jgi:hypothetical protein
MLRSIALGGWMYYDEMQRWLLEERGSASVRQSKVVAEGFLISTDKKAPGGFYFRCAKSAVRQFCYGKWTTGS